MEIIKGTLGERKALLKALDISIENMKCHYCKKLVNYWGCSILPPIKGKKTIIACDSPLCIATYLEEHEQDIK